MDLLKAIPEARVQLVFQAVDHAFASTEETGESLVPFALVNKNMNVTIHRFSGENQKKLLEKARRHIKEDRQGSEETTVALVYDGLLHEAGGTSDAFMVELFDFSNGMMHYFAQKYEKQTHSPFIVGQGNIAYLRSTGL